MVTEDQLMTSTKPSSDSEKEKQERTERMIGEAIRDYDGFDGYRDEFRIYAKGSYANNTNVRAESDVDIVVECTDVVYWRNHDTSRPGHTGGTPYSGIWTPTLLRSEILAALTQKFPGAVTEGSTAFEVNTSSARVNADVVPSFTFKLYYSGGSFAQGTKVFKKDDSSVENYPQQQLDNGRVKNSRTNSVYKKAVRILKRLENTLVAHGLTDPMPSFLLECLMYNCPDKDFKRNTWRGVMQGCLADIHNHTMKPEESDNRWVESNGIKYLFHPNQKWTRCQVHEFAKTAWAYMEFDG